MLFLCLTGQITNLLVIPLSSLSAMESQRSSAQLCVSSLEKAPQLTKASEGTITLLPTYCSFEDHHGSTAFRSSNLLNQQILDLEAVFFTPCHINTLSTIVCLC